MPLTPQEVRDKVFRPTRMRRGYDEDEVDAFLDEVETELARLLNENAELRRQLQYNGAGAPVPGPAGEGATPLGPPMPMEPVGMEPAPVEMAGPEGGPAGPGPAGIPPEAEPGPFAPPPVLPAPVSPQPAAQQPAAQQPAAQQPAAQQSAAQQPAMVPAHAGAELDRLPDSEAEQLLRRTLVLAQRTAEQAIHEARTDADRIRGDAQHVYEEQIGRVEEDRRRLEGQVDQLRAFEREYRTRLRAYLELQLRELDKSGGQQQAGKGAVQSAARAPITQAPQGAAPQPSGPAGPATGSGPAGPGPAGPAPAGPVPAGPQVPPGGAAGSGRSESPFSAAPPVGSASEGAQGHPPAFQAPVGTQSPGAAAGDRSEQGATAGGDPGRGGPEG